MAKKKEQSNNRPCTDCGYANHDKPWKNSTVFKGICEKHQSPLLGDYDGIKIICPDWKPKERSGGR